jgi:hypothetical protein
VVASAVLMRGMIALCAVDDDTVLIIIMRHDDRAAARGNQPVNNNIIITVVIMVERRIGVFMSLREEGNVGLLSPWDDDLAL